MSLSLALGSAFNGLKANQTQFALLSKNIESAAAPHYVRKSAVLTTRIVAGQNLGLQVEVSRDVDERLIRDVRQHTGNNAALSAKVDYLQVWGTKIGQPQDESSIATSLNNFKISLLTLEGKSGSQVDQLNAVRAAQNLVTHINSLDKEAASMVIDADGQIKAKVDVVNENLRRIESLNKQIASGYGAASVADLRDQRDLLADQISAEIGITTYLRDNGEMVILARGGATLLDSTVNELHYSPMADLATADGTVLTPGSGNPSGIRSGALAGLFEVRDQVMPEFRRQLDEMASGLIRMFEIADASLAPGQAGLFTDAGGAFDASNISGLAGRIAVNGAVVPSSGGDLWRISSGMAAAAPLPAADSSQVTSFLDAFKTDLSFTPSDSLPSSGRIEDFTVSIVSVQQSKRTTAESNLRISGITLSTLQETRMNRDGVNVDDELMKISLVEHSYQASSAVITAVKEMLDTLIAAS